MMPCFREHNHVTDILRQSTNLQNQTRMSQSDSTGGVVSVFITHEIPKDKYMQLYAKFENQYISLFVLGQAEVVTAELTVPMREFYQRFFGDDAPYGLPDFHMSRGDWEVRLSTNAPLQFCIQMYLDGNISRTVLGIAMPPPFTIPRRTDSAFCCFFL